MAQTRKCNVKKEKETSKKTCQTKPREIEFSDELDTRTQRTRQNKRRQEETNQVSKRRKTRK